MCLKKPGGRCSPHAVASAAAARKKVWLKKERYDRTGTQTARKEMKAAQERYRLAIIQWQMSPVGLQYLGSRDRAAFAAPKKVRTEQALPANNLARRARYAERKAGAPVDERKRPKTAISLEYSHRDLLPSTALADDIQQVELSAEYGSNASVLVAICHHRRVGQKTLLRLSAPTQNNLEVRAQAQAALDRTRTRRAAQAATAAARKVKADAAAAAAAKKVADKAAAAAAKEEQAARVAARAARAAEFAERAAGWSNAA